MERRVEALKATVGTDRWLPNRQPVRTVSMPLSIERSRSDRICRFCLIRQLGSSLYLGRVLSPGVDGPAAGIDRYVLRQGNDMQYGGAHMLVPAPRKRDSR